MSKITIKKIIKKKGKVPITCLTAYSSSIAEILDKYCDIILVGDSLGMVLYGMKTTKKVNLDTMILHTKAVKSKTKRSIVVCDMPYKTYSNKLIAYKNAKRVINSTKCDAVKLEGGKKIINIVKYLVKKNIPVMGHIGLMPQSVHKIGGYGVQGNTASKARSLLDDALALEEAGCFAIVLESVPTRVARLITERLSIPVVGIGAGPGCDGQILVTYDLLGLFDSFTPKFVKQYANLSEVITKAIEQYICDVRESKFPDQEHSSSISDVEWRLLLDNLNDNGL